MKSPFIQVYFPGREEPEESAQFNKAVNTVLMVFALIIVAMFTYGIYLSIKPDSKVMPKITDADKNKSSNT